MPLITVVWKLIYSCRGRIEPTLGARHPRFWRAPFSCINPFQYVQKDGTVDALDDVCEFAICCFEVVTKGRFSDAKE